MEHVLIRPMNCTDKQQAQALWESRFTDSPSFIDWFFGARFLPECSVCAERNGEIVSMALGTPMTLSSQSAPLSAMMISGVSTKLGFEGRGYMFAVLSRLLRLCKDERIALAFNTPVQLHAYDAFGFLPCSRSLYATRHDKNASAFLPDPFPSVDELHALYSAVSTRYSAFVLRPKAEMQVKLDDYQADGGVCLTYRRNGALAGYLIACSTDSGAWLGAECLALDAAGYEALLKRMPIGSTVKLPPDCTTEGELAPQTVARCVDVDSVLRALSCDAPRAFHVTDPILTENNGVFVADGSDGSNAATLSVGALAQAVLGFSPSFERTDGKPCFTIDEY